MISSLLLQTFLLLLQSNSRKESFYPPKSTRFAILSLLLRCDSDVSPMILRCNSAF